LKLLNCRNAAGLTAARLAARHGHAACAQLLGTLKKLAAANVGRAAAGDGSRSMYETPAASMTSASAADMDARRDGGRDKSTIPRDVPQSRWKQGQGFLYIGLRPSFSHLEMPDNKSFINKCYSE